MASQFKRTQEHLDKQYGKKKKTGRFLVLKKSNYSNPN